MMDLRTDHMHSSIEMMVVLKLVSLSLALPSDNVRFNIKNIAVKDLKRGYVSSNSKDDLTKGAASFISQVIIMNHPGQNDYRTSHISINFYKDHDQDGLTF
ncbi:Elongation factor 1-alpha [Capsicum chinense]|nr:Elongation factor 1-alpha [Capsicum chinense]